MADIDQENKGIRINKTLKPWKKDVTTPKTENSVRLVLLPDAIFDELMEYTKHVYDLTPDNALFFYSYRNIWKYKGELCKKNNLREIRIHDFRHSHVSLLVDQGVSMMLIADRIGDSVDTVQKTYAHLYPNINKSVAEKLNFLVSY